MTSLHQQVMEKIPTKWYESHENGSIPEQLFTVLIGTLSAAEIIAILSSRDGIIHTSLLSAAFYAVCVALDFLSTYKAFSFLESVPEDVGSEHSVVMYETAMGLEDVRTAREFVKRCWTKQQTIMLFLSLFPPLGIAVGADRMFAALSNMRELRRFKWSLRQSTADKS